MGRNSGITQKEAARAHKAAVCAKVEAIDKATGWTIVRRFKNKAELAIFVNNPDKIADIDFQYPLYNYRRKLDLDNCYLAVIRK